MEVGSSYAEGRRGEVSGEGILRSRGLSAVVGVRIGSARGGGGGVLGLSVSVICGRLGATVIVDN